MKKKSHVFHGDGGGTSFQACGLAINSYKFHFRFQDVQRETLMPWSSNKVSPPKLTSHGNSKTASLGITGIRYQSGISTLWIDLPASDCWWFRNPIPNHRKDGCLKNPVNNGISKPYQLVSLPDFERTINSMLNKLEDINHDPIYSWHGCIADSGRWMTDHPMISPAYNWGRKKWNEKPKRKMKHVLLVGGFNPIEKH